MHYWDIPAKLKCMSATIHQQPTMADMKAALDATRLPPREHFARMVHNGLIDAAGKLTRLYGGDAEPDASAKTRSQDAVQKNHG